MEKSNEKGILLINEDNTCEFTTLLDGHNATGVKWVFKTKTNAKTEVGKHKVWVVVQGYKQQFGIDYKEVFALVAHLKIMRLLISFAARKH